MTPASSVETQRRLASEKPTRHGPGSPLADGILDTIGNTPLVRLRRYLDSSHIDLYAKLEMANPGGSAKDRPATRMLAEALERGLVGPETLVVESSSGNTAIGLAQFCNFHGLRFRCIVDPRTQTQNVAILAAYGAEVDCVREPDAVTGDFLTARLERVQQTLAAHPDSFWPNQYANPDNPLSHQQGTIREIVEALDGRLDLLFVATSSTGTAQGCRRYLQEQGLATGVVAVDARGSVLFGGQRGERRIPGLGAGKVPPLARSATFDHVQRVSDLECVIGCRRLARRESILAGGSSGGVLEAVRRMAPELSEGTVCVAILADRGTRYLDTVYNDQWVDEALGCSPETLRRAVEDSTPTDPSDPENNAP